MFQPNCNQPINNPYNSFETMLKQLLQSQLVSNKNADQVKQTIRQKMARVQTITYHHFASDQQQFMQYFAKATVQPEKLSILDELTRERCHNVAASIQNGDLELPLQENETITTKVEPPPQQAQTLTIELRNREEYPISANYDYWSMKHGKSIETKEYMKKLHEQDRKIKEEIRGKKMAVEEAKRQKAEAARQEQLLLEIQKKEQIKDQAMAKISIIKQQQEERMEKEKEFRQFLKQFKAKQPLHVKVQQQFHEKFQIPLLEQRKLKLQQLRSIRKPSLAEIQQHARKHDQQQMQRSRSPIHNQPIKVSYRSKFHSSFDSGHPSNTVKQLYEKKNQYGKMVKQDYKPVPSQRLVEEMMQRMEPKDPLSLRYKKVKGQGDDDDDDSDDEQDNGNATQRKKEHRKEADPGQGEGSDQDQDGDDQGVDDEPQCAFRNKLGNQYLDYVRKLKKKPGPTRQQRIKMVDQLQQQELQKMRQKVIRPNYIEDLKQMRSQSAATKNPSQNWQSDLNNPRIDEGQKKRRMFIKSQRIAELAQRKEQVLSHYKLSQNDMLQQKKKVDSQYLQAIRAKLALMQV